MHTKNQAGFSLIEVLISILVSVIGLVGCLNLQATMFKSMQESYNRTQALLVMGEIQDRIYSNKPSAPCYAISGHLGTDSTLTPSCTVIGSNETKSLATKDLIEIDSLLRGVNEVNDNGDFIGGLLKGKACIELVDTTSLQTYNITIVWQGINNIPSSVSSTCGGDTYGGEGYKRVYQSTINIARLSA